MCKPTRSFVANTLHQPWAWLVIHGGKDIENRTWTTDQSGIIAIHASVRRDDATYWRAYDWVLDNVSKTTAVAMPLPDGLEYGGIIGTVELLGYATFAKSRWFEGPVGWFLSNPRPVPFFRCRGFQRFWNVPAEFQPQVCRLNHNEREQHD